jgi:hypothetical protein
MVEDAPNITIEEGPIRDAVSKAEERMLLERIFDLLDVTIISLFSDSKA